MTTPLTKAPPASLAALSPDVWTAPFWEACAEHRLVCQRCTSCGAFRTPPAPFCWSCRTQDAEWAELSGHGHVYSFTVVHHPVLPDLAEIVPYVIAVVALDGAPGARLVANIVDADPDAVEIGAAVTVHWDDVAEGTSIPRFVLDT